jgi:hypothetical protein
MKHLYYVYGRTFAYDELLRLKRGGDACSRFF